MVEGISEDEALPTVPFWLISVIASALRIEIRNGCAILHKSAAEPKPKRGERGHPL